MQKYFHIIKHLLKKEEIPFHFWQNHIKESDDFPNDQETMNYARNLHNSISFGKK